MWFAWGLLLLLLITVSYAHNGFNFLANSNGVSSIRLTYTTPASFWPGDVSYKILLWQSGKWKTLTFFDPPHTVWNHNGLSSATKYRYQGYVFLHGRAAVYEREAWTLPLTPSRPTINQRNANNIIMKVTPIPDSRQDYHYKVIWSTFNEQSQTHEMPCTDLICKVNGLQPTTRYVFATVGCFTIGPDTQQVCSAVSEKDYQWTAAPNPNAFLSKVGHDTLEVRYEPVVGGLLGYTYKLFSNGNTTACNQETKTCDLENLQSGSQYTMTVVTCFMIPGGSGEICCNAVQGRMSHWTIPNSVAEASLKRREPTLLEVQIKPLEDTKHTYIYKLRTDDQEVICEGGVCVINNLYPSKLYTMKIAACFKLPDDSPLCGNFDDKVIEGATSPS